MKQRVTELDAARVTRECKKMVTIEEFRQAIMDTETEGYFAVFDLEGKIKATEIYSRNILDNLVIPDILKNHPGAYYKIFHESEFNRVVKSGTRA